MKFLSVLFLSFSVLGFSRIPLSPDSKVSVVVQGPYQKEIYSAFGHIGVRVQDSSKKMDWFFNYGVYDFDQENFFFNFARGLLKYKVVFYEFKYFMNSSIVQNRYVKELELNLTQEERQKFIDYLYQNVRPENAEYLYNYVYDNCATKIRDISDEILPGKITYDYSYKSEGKTIRDLMGEYLEYQAWGDFGIDIGLGTQIDREATANEYMFLPEYVLKAFQKATLERQGRQVPLVLSTDDLFVAKKEEFSTSLLTPFNFFVLLFFLVGLITNRDFKKGTRTKWIDYFLFSLVGFVGLWVTYLWFGTQHLSKWNLNILWALPIHLIVMFLMLGKKYRAFLKKYFKFFGWWYLLLLVAWGILPQPLHVALVPLVLTLVLRAFYISYDLGKT